MVSKRRILVIDDEYDVRNIVAGILTSKKAGYDVVQAANALEGLELAQKQPFDHIISDIYMQPEDGLQFLKKAKDAGVSANIIMMSGQADIDMALEAIKIGACDFIFKPLVSDHLLFVLRRAEEKTVLLKENALLKAEVHNKYSFHNIVAKSPQIKQIFEVIQRVADYKTTVAITGESGTGKELVAKAIHFNSTRAKAPFVPINCGGIPENLLESELFGYVKGAFTDAVRAKKGLFEEAHKGTLFLDELGDMPLSLQVRLLRVLQEEEIRPLGDTRSIQVDVRIVAATAKDLAQEVSKGNFREDLFYRINVLSIVIPALRDRKEDIPLLVDHFIERYNFRLKKKVERASPEVMRLFLEYKWPGNIRELENAIESAMVYSDTPIIHARDLPPNIRAGFEEEIASPISVLDVSIFSIKKSSKMLERELIIKALDETKGNKTKASRLLEISLPALLYKIKDYGLAKET
ncbi:MAG: sigma-54-dependent Fis family transcriptional regulator [Deltaproteobacteria bacterium]|nr:sigma-54-dependent Fis family transcriptional regulator [Deltaproteobacteria bacterium]MBW1719513.1 sigma-54-dependent Fis family transcriptional regulator [Deltaproteobacteria bacterium]MBW1932670.1 sigma-54-dependent Fis family transcriptional regulator [Deltaproteobacteria bacterium]MBW1938590.1 sigma-54-dependent Fis family transcriptional regulator [Deltaproteobacteria bacterium]MBW1964331.1 sigma-54-dependent Fis family transcriptional regulator [Deltaproteobacteria bacterium]